MKIAVVGAGGIGAFIAAALARAGTNVAVVARGEHLRAIQARGIRVESDLGRFTAEVEAAADLRAFATDFDALLLTFKAHQWSQLLEQLAPYATTTALIATLQNGLPFWFERTPPLRSIDPDGRIGNLFADARIAGGVVHVSGNLPEPGKVKQSGGLRYLLGAPDGTPNPAIDTLLATMQRAGLDAQLDPHIRTTVWLKLVNNCGLNPVSALRGLTIGALLADANARNDVRALMEEALQVGQVAGIHADVDIEARIAYAARLDDVQTSMLQDMQRGRRLELDPILGAAIELAQRYGVDVPHLRETYAALRERSQA